MIALLGALRDPRVWLVILVGIAMRLGFEWGFGRHVEKTLEEREERLSHLSPEDRMDEELRTLGRISTEVLGVDVEADVERAIADQRRAEEDLRATLEAAGYEPLAADRFRPSGVERASAAGTAAGGLVIGENGAVVKGSMRLGPREEQGAPLPAWAVAAGAGLLIAGMGGVISVLLLRRAGDEGEEPDSEESSPSPPPLSPQAGRGESAGATPVRPA